MTLSSHHADLQKMIKGFRVSDLQTLLIYGGKNKAGKKSELQARALDLLKTQGPHMTSLEMKIRELHRNRYTQTHGHVDPPELYSSEMYSHGLSDPIGNSYSSMANHKSSLGPGVGIPNYVQTLNHQMIRSVPALNVMPQYPVNPDVRFKELPFYDVLNILHKPTSLVPHRGEGLAVDKDFMFYLGPQDLRDLDSNTDVQVQFRISSLGNEREHEDDWPSTCSVKVNNKGMNLPPTVPTNKPGVEAKRLKRPIDITSGIKRSSAEPQMVTVSWNSNNKPLVVAIFLVRKQSSSVLIKRLKEIGVRNPDHTTAMIKEKLCHDRDSEIATMSLRGSLVCPLGKIKMTLPCRALSCTHLQCFDAALYIQMNEKKPKWICPVCDKPAIFKSLAIDGLFLDITRKVPSECTEVQFHENGSWTPVIPVKKVPEISEVALQTPKQVEVPAPKPKKTVVEVVNLDSDSDTEEDSWPAPPPKKKPYKPVGIISPVTIDNSENSPKDTAEKSYDILEPCSSKSILSAPKGNSLLPEKSTSQNSSSYPYIYSSSSSKDFESPPYSAESPSPQSSGNTTFQAPVEIPVDIINPPNTAGPCYDFDLYSLIQPNTEESFPYQDNSAEETILPDETPDIISID